MGQNPAETGKTALPRSVMRGVWGSRGGAGGVNTIESGPPAAQSGPWRRPSASGSRGRGGSAAARPWSCQRSRPATGAAMGGRYPAPPEAPGNPQEPLRAWRRHPRCPRHLAGAGPGGCPPRRRRNPTSAASAAKPSGRERTWCGTAASTPARSPTSVAPAPRASPRTPTSGSTSAPTPVRSPTSAAPVASASAGVPTSPSTSASTAARNPSRAASAANASAKAPACSNTSAATPARSPTAAPTAPRTSAGAPTSCPTTAASTPPNGGPARPWRCPRGSEGLPKETGRGGGADDSASVVTTGTCSDLLLPFVNRKVYGGSLTGSTAATTLPWWPRGPVLSCCCPSSTGFMEDPRRGQWLLQPFCGGHGDVVWPRWRYHRYKDFRTIPDGASGYYSSSVMATCPWVGPTGTHRQHKDFRRSHDMASGCYSASVVATGKQFGPLAPTVYVQPRVDP